MAHAAWLLGLCACQPAEASASRSDGHRGQMRWHWCCQASLRSSLPPPESSEVGLTWQLPASGLLFLRPRSFLVSKLKEWATILLVSTRPCAVHSMMCTTLTPCHTLLGHGESDRLNPRRIGQRATTAMRRCHCAVTAVTAPRHGNGAPL